ncbi:MAG: GvpL/GvpF family gas vesicle protein [Xenococcaceae cyanobacterium]
MTTTVQTKYGYYLYGIFPLPAPEITNIQGLDKQPVNVEIVDGFALLYSEAQQKKYLASRRNLLNHERVLEEAMEAGYRNLLPLQFGLCVESWEEVLDLLITSRRQELEELLNKLSGYREVGVKLMWETEAEIEMLLHENPELKAQRDALIGKNLSLDETIKIGQAIETAIENRQDEIIQAFQNSLAPLAKELVENDCQMQQMIYNAAYLIPWEKETEFSQKVEELDKRFEGRLRIRYNAFTAPFNFAKLQ